MEKKITVGFLGAGKSTHRYQGPFVQRRPEKFSVKTVWARNLSHLKWEPLAGAAYTEDLQGMLNDPEIDVIIVCTPVMHYEYAKMVLEAGKHVIVEKPFTETYAQAKELFDLAEERGLTAQCIQNRRFDSYFLTAQEVIASGKLGEIYEVEMHYDYYRPIVPETVKEFRTHFGMLYGHGTHTIDQALSYFGIPEKVHYDVRQLLGEGRMNDYFDLDLYYPDGLKVSVSSSYFRMKQRPRIVVYGKKGVFIKESDDRQEYDLKRFYMPTPDHPDFGMDREEHYGTLYYYDEYNEYHEEKVPSVTGDYARYYDAVYETLVNHVPQLVAPQETLYQMKMLEEGDALCK